MMKKLLICLLCLLLTGCGQIYDGPTQEARVLLGQEFIDVAGEERTVTFVAEYGYDTYGNRASIRTRWQNDPESVTNCRYDEAGRELSATSWELHWGIPIFEDYRETSYDAQGRVVRETIWPLDFWNRYSYTHTYDEGVTTMAQLDSRGDVVFRQEEHTDVQGRLVKLVYDNYAYHYTYDAAGNCIREERVENGTVTYQVEKTYDAQGRVLTNSYLSAEGQPRTHRWTYDDEARTVTLHRADGYVTVEHYNEYGENYYTAKYDDAGVLIGEDRNTYGVILVPAKEDVP